MASADGVAMIDSETNSLNGSGHPVCLCQARQTRCHLDEGGLSQIVETFFLCLVGNLDGVAILHDNTCDAVCNRNHFIDSHPPLVAIVAGVAAHRGKDMNVRQLGLCKASLQQHTVGQFHRRLAMVAEPSTQALSDDEAD